MYKRQPFTYSVLSGSPTTYNITYSSAAHTAGFTDVTASPLSGGTVNIVVPAGASPATYSGTITVNNSLCASAAYPVTATVAGYPTAVVTAAPQPCPGSTAAITIAATTGAVLEYIADGGAAVDTTITGGGITLTTPPVYAAHTYEIVNIHNSACTTTYDTLITITPVPMTAGYITGTAILCAGSTTTLTDTASGGSWTSSATSVATVSATGVVSGISAGVAVISYARTNICGTVTTTDTVTVTTPPAITTGTMPSVCAGATVAPFTYSVLSGSPTTYNITYSSAAHTAGFTNVTAASLSGGTVNIVVPAGASPATYSGTITVRNGSCASAGYPVTATVASYPTAVVTAAPQPCIGYSSAITIAATTGAVLEYIADGGAAVDTVITGG